MEASQNKITADKIKNRSPLNAPRAIPLPEHEQWESEKIFFDGDSFFESLCKDISTAQKSIYLETYIFFNDALGQRISKLLIDAARRGVDVKVIVDGVGSPFWKFFFQSSLENAGVKCKIFHRVPFNIASHFPMLFTNFRLLFTHLEKRNHRKLWIIDEKIGYVGSMNVAAYHLKEFNGDSAWRDTGAKVSGTAVSTLTDSFQTTWESSLFSIQSQINGSSLVRVYNSRKKKRALYKDFLNKIETAQERIWLTTAYFVPNGSLLKKLTEAAKRNVDIIILTTEKTDVFIIRWLRAAFYYGLLKAGAKIFEYKPSILHAKCALIDDFAIVGSTNLNSRSFFRDLELDIVLKKPESLDSIEDQFVKDLRLSTEIKKSDWKDPIYSERLMAKIALIFRHWL